MVVLTPREVPAGSIGEVRRIKRRADTNRALRTVGDAMRELGRSVERVGEAANTVLIPIGPWNMMMELERKWQRRRFVLLGVLLGILGALCL